jgi:hypothetical protein
MAASPGALRKASPAVDVLKISPGLAPNVETVKENRKWTEAYHDQIPSIGAP